MLVVPSSPAAAQVPLEALDVPAALAPAIVPDRAAERAARTLNHRTTPVAQRVVQPVAQAAVKKPAKPAVKTVKPVVKAAARPATRKAPAVEKVTVSGRGAIVAQFGLSQVGERYVWGSSGPNQWDCSGLSQGAARAAGVSLPHQSGAQMSYGRAISRSQLQPGDLVFWSGHVAISLGGNRIVHAANSRVGVVVGTIYGTPIGYRRIV